MTVGLLGLRWFVFVFDFGGWWLVVGWWLWWLWVVVAVGVGNEFEGSGRDEIENKK